MRSNPNQSPIGIGVFGGSFDPPHLGHFISARIAAEQLHLERVIVVPTHIQPLKAGQTLTPAELRWEMVKAAVSDDALFQPDRTELDRGGVSYTVDTLRELAARYPAPAHQLYLLLGADSLAEMDAWRDRDEIFRLARVAVMARLENDSPALPESTERPIFFLKTPVIEISSTMIRRRVAQRLPIRMLVGAEVDAVIAAHRLYQD